MEKLIVISKSEFKKELFSVLEEFDREKESKIPPKLFTINQVAKMFGKAHGTIKRMVEAGVLRSTLDGLIPEDALNEYLQINV